MQQKSLKEILSRADVVLSTLTGSSQEGILKYVSRHMHTFSAAKEVEVETKESAHCFPNTPMIYFTSIYIFFYKVEMNF